MSGQEMYLPEEVAIQLKSFLDEGDLTGAVSYVESNQALIGDQYTQVISWLGSLGEDATLTIDDQVSTEEIEREFDESRRMHPEMRSRGEQGGFEGRSERPEMSSRGEQGGFEGRGGRPEMPGRGGQGGFEGRGGRPEMPGRGEQAQFEEGTAYSEPVIQNDSGFINEEESSEY